MYHLYTTCTIENMCIWGRLVVDSTGEEEEEEEKNTYIFTHTHGYRIYTRFVFNKTSRNGGFSVVILHIYYLL